MAQREVAGVWQVAEPIVGSNHHRGNPSIISLEDGRWMIMWSESTLSTDGLSGLTGDQVAAQQELWYAIRDSNGWSTPVRMTNNGVCDDSPRIIRCNDGTVLAVWRQMSGTDTTDISASNLVYAVWDGNTWSTLAVLADTAERLSQPALACLPNGNLVATWLSDAGPAHTKPSIFRQLRALDAIKTTIHEQPYTDYTHKN
jgi:hypothetical protein